MQNQSAGQTVESEQMKIDSLIRKCTNGTRLQKTVWYNLTVTRHALHFRMLFTALNYAKSTLLSFSHHFVFS